MQGDQAEKKGKVKKGWLAVRVGQAQTDQQGQQGNGFRRFVIPIAYLYHPFFQRLLEVARDMYCYDSAGPLRLPCSVDEFLRLRTLVDRKTAHSHSSSSHRVHVHAGGHQRRATPSPRSPAPKSAHDRPTARRLSFVEHRSAEAAGVHLPAGDDSHTCTRPRTKRRREIPYGEA